MAIVSSLIIEVFLDKNMPWNGLGLLCQTRPDKLFRCSSRPPRWSSPAKFHPYPIWNDGALDFFWKRLPQQAEQQQQSEKRRGIRSWSKKCPRLVLRAGASSVHGPVCDACAPCSTVRYKYVTVSRRQSVTFAIRTAVSAEQSGALVSAFTNSSRSVKIVVDGFCTTEVWGFFMNFISITQ